MAKKPSFESAVFLAALGENVLAYRETSGMSQADLGRLIGVSVNFIDRLERGRANVRILALEKVAIALGAELTTLLDTSGTEIGHALSSVTTNGR